MLYEFFAAKITIVSWLVNGLPLFLAKLNFMARKDILDAGSVKMKLQRMAFEIIENNLEEERIILAGILDNGNVIARSMQQILTENSSMKVDLINISLDKKQPHDITLSESRDFNNQVIIVVDDVANSGRTILYALKPLLEYLPKKIQTMALVERTHKTFPVHLDYKGLSVATTLQEHIYVEVNGDNVVGAYME
jgi:pyrimidine operon attenuation protein/uracil phosphoribosyltransferase